MRKEKGKAENRKEALKRNLRAWKLWWKVSPGIFLSKIISAVCGAIAPYVLIYLSARIIDELAGQRDPDQLFQLVLTQIIAAAALALLGDGLKRWEQYEQSGLFEQGFRFFVDKALEMDYPEADNPKTHELYAEIVQNTCWTDWGMLRAIDLLEELAGAVIRVAGGLGLAAGLFLSQVPDGSGMEILNHPLCAVGFIGILGFAALIPPFCTGKNQGYWLRYRTQQQEGNLFYGVYDFNMEDQSRALDQRMYRQRERIADVYLGDVDTFMPGSQIAKDAKGPMGMWTVAGQAVSTVLTGMIYLFVCLKAWAGAFGVGAVTQYVGAVTNLFLGFSKLLETVSSLRVNGEFLKDCTDFLDMPDSLYHGSLTTEKRSDRQYDVEFRDVSFRYPGTDTNVLSHVNMKFRVGSRLAIVGMNGSGKTTFIKLLCRLYDPTEGQILLNGIDIKKYRYEDYIDLFSVVFQDFQLLAMPLGQNVAGRMEYDREKALDCLEKAGFGERLKAMPKGLDTWLYKELDKDGVEVSGGEAQKIAIARALYKDAPFLILDEPTAALDPMAEAEIYSQLNEITGDRTAIYISHRLSSCKFCDEIAVFDQGKIIQQGSHEELAADETGKYYELWNAQAQYYV